MASEIGQSKKAWSVLIVSTLAFTVCFMVWMMFGVIGIPIRKMLNLNATQFGLLMATPVLTGSLIRVPLGIWTDRFGGRVVMAVLMAMTVPAIWVMSYATAYWHFLTIGLFVGLAGGSFSVGTPYVARWFPKKRQGMAMGVYGAGNSGSAVNKFIAPVLLVAIIFMWTPPHFWALALYRVEDYRKSGLPMLPVKHGNEFTRLQIFLYTLVLFAACLLPFVFKMSGWLYLVAAVILSIGFSWYGWKLWRVYSDALARKTFRFSLIHLSLLFAALLVDHYLV
jgi:nitrate/nitrite transporter NarK